MPPSPVVVDWSPVNLVGVESPVLTGHGLPHREQPIHVRVKQEHERILERLMLGADVPTDVAMRGVVPTLQGQPECGPLLGLGGAVAGGDDGLIRRNTRVTHGRRPLHRLRRIGRVAGVLPAPG